MAVHVGKLGIVRLDEDEIGELREDCYHRDGGRCVDCGERIYLEGYYPRRMEMAHILSRGAGGSDTLDNVQSKCGLHHTYEHNGGRKVVPAKPRAAA